MIVGSFFQGWFPCELLIPAAALHCSTETFLQSRKHFTSRAGQNKPNSPKIQWQGTPCPAVNHPSQSCIPLPSLFSKHKSICPWGFGLGVKTSQEIPLGHYFFSPCQEQIAARAIDKVTQSLCELQKKNGAAKPWLFQSCCKNLCQIIYWLYLHTL